MELQEVISSEELLSYVDDLNKQLEELGAPEEGLCIGSLDVKALYPSLVIKHCAKITHDRIIRSGMKFDNVDLKWACIYIALNCQYHEVVRAGLHPFVPTRRTKSGRPPTVKTINVDEKNQKVKEKDQDWDKDRWKWPKVEQIRPEDSLRIMAKVVEVMINACFESHIYKWDITIRRQKVGGAIGGRATGALAKITMDQ